MTETKEVAYDALREMYSEAEPPLDFDSVLENPDDYEDEWYSEHYLCGERQKEIVQKYCEKHNLDDRQHMTVTMIAILDLGPRSTKEENMRT